MRLIKHLVSAYLYGFALAKFQKGKYKKALPLFEKVYKIEYSFDDPHERVELILYHIAWCHIMLKNNRKILEAMAAAYVAFQNRLISKINIDNNYLKYFKKLSNEYVKVLSENDQVELAEKISKETKSLIVENGAT